MTVDDCNFDSIDKLTDFHPENVRRYMGHGRVPVYFLATFAEAFGVSTNWLVWGEGPQRRRAPRQAKKKRR